MNDIFIINKNNKEYVHIDTIKYKNQMIYHFGSLEDEIFCTKKDMEYIPIQDNLKISIIKNKLGLINSTKIYSLKEDSKEFANRTQDEFKFYLKLLKKKIIYRDITATVIEGEEKEKIIDEQKNNFKKIKEKFNLDIDLEKINEKISKVKLIKKEKILGGRTSGYYNSVFNFVALKNKNDITSDTEFNKHVRLHEFIHAMTGKKSFLYHMAFLRGLQEGKTENLVESFFGSKTSCFEVKKRESEYNNGDIEIYDRIQYNFNENIKYKPLVSVVKQMEHALGEKSHKSIINGNMEFESNFAKKYGMPLLIFMVYRTRMLKAAKNLNRIFEDLQLLDEVKYFKETQDILMKKVFDKDFKNIKNIEDAKLYFQKLRNFETVRGRISTKNGYDFIYYEDKSFEDYYNEKYVSTIETLKRNGFTEEEIQANLESYKYERQEFKTFQTKEEEKDFMKLVVASHMSNVCIEEKKMVDLKKYEYRYFKISPNIYYTVFIDKESGEKNGFEFKVDGCSDSEIRNAKNVLDELGLESEERCSCEEACKILENKGYKQEKIEFADKELEMNIMNQFIGRQKEIENQLFNFIMKGISYNRPREEAYEELAILRKFLGQEKSEKTKSESNISPELAKEMMEIAQKQKVHAWAGPGPGPGVTAGDESVKNKKGKIAEKIAKLKGLITLKKSQDKEIEQLEDNIKKKGKTIDGQ